MVRNKWMGKELKDGWVINGWVMIKWMGNELKDG